VTGFAIALAGALATAGAAMPAAAEMYSWRTEDGGYAFTDDEDQIPARYRGQAKAVQQKSLASYERYTPQDSASSAQYAQRLGNRLAALRAANEASEASARETAGTGSHKLLLTTGGTNAPQIDASIASAEEPVVIEPRLMAAPGDFRTRRVTIVRQGDKTLAVIKSSQHNYNVSQDILDEEDYDANRD
jgi:hypothetical protein